MKDHPSPHASQARRGPLKGGRSSISPRPHIRPPEDGAEVEGTDVARVDWEGAEITGVTFTRYRFDDAQLLELVTRRCVFDFCQLTGVRLGGSRHLGSAFLSCRFDRAWLFDVTWDGCKLTGSQFPGAGPLQGPAASLRVVGGRGCFSCRGSISPAGGSGRPT